MSVRPGTTARDLYNEMVRLTREMPDRVNPQDEGGCLYIGPNNTHCLVGQALVNLSLNKDETRDELALGEQQPGAAVAEQLGVEFDAERWIDVITTFQVRADTNAVYDEFGDLIAKFNGPTPWGRIRIPEAPE